MTAERPRERSASTPFEYAAVSAATAAVWCEPGAESGWTQWGCFCPLWGVREQIDFAAPC
jgi:hypothetical protein